MSIPKNKPNILITAGDPKGIGPEVTKKALEDSRIKNLARFVIIESGDKTGFEAIKKAGEILKQGTADGVVTAPVNKAAINRSGIAFKGHTEYFAGVTNTKKFVMMFCGCGMKVSIVTRHIALRDVPRFLTQGKIEDAVTLTYSALKKYFRIPEPVIGVSGLNPHCGEGGVTGTEEKEIIAPAIKKLKRTMPGVQGPFPADAIFHMVYNKKFDAVVSMYHDQGLGPFKMVAFAKGVNVTLGLPFVRTSPDHGTAYDLAGKGIADPESMKEAIKLAVKMCLT